jgi:hypothetical protein
MSFSQKLNQLVRSNLKQLNYYTAKSFIKSECKSAAKRGYRELHIKWTELGVTNEKDIMIQQLISYFATAKSGVSVCLLIDHTRHGNRGPTLGLSFSWK